MQNMKKPKTFRGLYLNDTITAYVFIAPFMILMTIWFYYPVFSSFIISLNKVSSFNYFDRTFIGLENYINTLKDEGFRKSLANSMIITAFCVPIQTFLALVVAACLNSIEKLKGFFRTLYYLPYITSAVAVTLVFMGIFVQKDGIATRLFSIIGFRNVSWFADMDYAMPFLIMLIIWTNIGFYTVIYLAGLQSISKELYEASEVDGANFIQRFLHITIPMLKPVTFFVILTGVINALQIFEQPYALAGGDPQRMGGPGTATTTMTIYFFRKFYVEFDAGAGCAAAIMIFVIILAFSVVQKLILERKERA